MIAPFSFMKSGESFFGNALAFDGTDDYVSTANFGGNTSGDYTMSFWAKVNTFSTSNYLFYWGNASSNEDYFIANHNASNQIRFQWRSGTTGNYDDTAVITDGSWVHVCVSRIGTTTKAYINGIEVLSTTNSETQVSLDPFFIMGSFRTAILPLNGVLDEFAIWRGTGATPANVTDLYNGGDGQLASDVIASPNRYYRFNESNPTATAPDIGTDGADGTLNNFNFTPTSGWVAH